jgi:hypothetical protein
MQLGGGRGWSLQLSQDDDLAAVLAVRETADLHVSHPSIPEPLRPSPRIERLFVSQRVREAAAQPWAAWWRIAVAAKTAQHRESNIVPEPPLFDLPTLWTLDPPKFASLAAAPELKQIVVSTWPAILEWLQDLRHLRPETPSENWEAELIAQADRNNGSPIADVMVHLGVLPIAGSAHWVLTEDPRRHLLHALV